MQPSQAGEKASAVRQYAQSVASMPDGRDRLQALGTIAQMLQQIPKAMRQTVIQQLDIPNDMKPAVQEIINAEPIKLGTSTNPIFK
jgi:hypothetical protein